MSAGDVSFGTFLMLNRPTYAVTRIDPNVAPVDIMRLPLARREGSMTSLTRNLEQVIGIEGVVEDAGRSATTAQANLDALVVAVSNGQQNLKIGYNDERYWKARLLGQLVITRLMPYIFSYKATFLAVDAFGYALTASSSAPGVVQFTLV